MKAMILAAGLGKRMLPLTIDTPKPMLKVNGMPLIEHHIHRLKQAGIVNIVINYAQFGEQIEQYFADGANWGVSIQYSRETEGPLETAGGITKALPLLGEHPFLIVNGDIYCEYEFDQLPTLANEQLAHLIMVNNPEHNPNGDFAFDQTLLSMDANSKRYTYSGVGIYSPKMFDGLAVEKRPLAPLLMAAINNKQVSASLYLGLWSDIGTPVRLKQINNQLVGR
jgi:MurNAc alpha-1-phosphate uridylyltransferase